ncbi:conserved membrane hypothetical protein [Candidatus Terasakiella magnetica]|nr:conserved membrane hypothetical protein [Candidatus Terasakiella magnetica]
METWPLANNIVIGFITAIGWLAAVAINGLPLLLLIYFTVRYLKRTTASPLAITALDLLYSDLKAAHPDKSDADIIALLRQTPDLVAQCVGAIARHHPSLPEFHGSWKFRSGIRRHLASLEQQAREASLTPEQRTTIARRRTLWLFRVPGIALLLIGVPTFFGAGALFVDSLHHHLLHLHERGEAWNAVFAVIGGIFTLFGAACGLAGGWLIRRARQRR